MLFGYGDGGGGPTRRMLEILRRTKDLLGVPRTEIRTSEEFFTRLEKDLLELPVVVGELYFEYHRGTYTTQAATKRYNRKNEWLLHDIEFAAALAWRTKGTAYPHAELASLWHTLLINQFHDILPGSSITEVYHDTVREHEELARRGHVLLDAALGPAEAPWNMLGVPRQEVTARPDGTLCWVDVPSYGVGRVMNVVAGETVSLEETPTGFVLENRALRAEIGKSGAVERLLHKPTGRDALTGHGNVLELYDDHPTAWDAWDVDPFHLETMTSCPPATTASVEVSSLRAEVVFERRIGTSSRLVQRIRLDAGARRLEFHTEVDWHESHKLLKVAFPVPVRAMNATYEMQFGCVERPTHFNTLADMARFEVPGHRFADLSEHGFGVALLSESKYGWSTQGSTLRMTLLRSPKSPDPQADMGHHVFSYAVYPHAGGWQVGGVVAEGLRFNQPVLWGRQADPESFFTVEDPNLVLDTVKKAEDSDALVLRFYECHGARGTARIECALPVTSATRCNLLEDDGEALSVYDGDFEVDYEPYKLITVKIV
jgi:alpha-mannosidase